MPNIYIVGTLHEFQKDDGSRERKEIESFISFLRDTCKEKEIKAIAEEMSLEALFNFRDRGSTCSILAKELAIAHRYCDPESDIRSKLEVREDSEIKMLGFLNNLSDDELNNQIRINHEKREVIWLREIRNLNLFPLLFICGAKHAVPFGELLKKEGFKSSIVSKSWGLKK